MEYKEKGTIKNVLPVESGTSQNGKEWKKLNFVIANNNGYERAEQIFAFEIFGTEKVDNFIKYNKLGQEVEVSFNIRTNEWKGKYYTSLQAWKVMAGERVEQAAQTPQPIEDEESEILPF
jgi:hypothetical protein